MSGYGLAIFDQHAKMLTASGITPEHARARGYVSVDTKRRLDGLNITPTGRRVPGLLVPQLRADGSTWGYQYRPDSPRERNGKSVKYETPTGQRNGIDVPPGVGPRLRDPSVPLWVTEGIKKADAGALAGLCIVALPGVWSWRGRSETGGRVAVADWHDIALNDRRVILAFDSDATTKAAVRSALLALAEYLTSKGAKVEYAHLPEVGDGKCGIDDYLTAGHTLDQLRALVRPEPPAVKAAPEPVAPVPAVPSVPPPPEDAVAMLDAVWEMFARYVAFPSVEALDAVTLWVAHTHVVASFESTPRLAVLSPEPQSGKTRTLEVAELLVRAPMFTSNTTVAVLARSVDAYQSTVLLDEADSVFGSRAKEHEDLRAILNAGHRRGATYDRMTGEGAGMTVKRFSVFTPVALAGIGDLPETVMQRSVVVRMRRRAPAEVIAPFRARSARGEAEPLREQLAGWAATVAAALMQAWPVMP